MVRYTRDGDEAPSESVPVAVAEVRDCSTTDLRPLAERIDPDALDALFESGAATREVTFRYAGCAVTVTDTELHVRELDE